MYKLPSACCNMSSKAKHMYDECRVLSEVGGSLLRLKMVMYVLGERFVEL